MGTTAPRICILNGPTLSISAQSNGASFGDYERYLLDTSLAKIGIDPSTVHFTHIHPRITEELNSQDFTLILTMGEQALKYMTGKSGIDKWHLSPLDSLLQFKCRKIIPTFDIPRLNKQYEYRMFFHQAFHKIQSSLYEGPWKRKTTNYTLITEPSQLEVSHYLDGQSILSVDIETSLGTINTMGLAWSPTDAIAVRIEPGRYEPRVEFQFWLHMAKYLEDPDIKKILQNNIYEATYFSRYGINLTNVWHDTMWAQKLLYPEFKQGLDVVGRLYTNEVYWKEDGKDWSKIDNWIDHMIYNCKDTSNTYEAAMNQRKDLTSRGLLEFFDGYLMKLADPIIEMCCTGLTVDQSTKARVEQETLDEISLISQSLSQPINHRSSKQKIELFKSKGYKIPKKRDSKGAYKESVDELSLKKMRLKYPGDTDIAHLLSLAKLNKFYSSYIDFDYHTNGQVHYSIRGSGTETLRFSSGSDSWDLGFNAQTIPKKAKKFFIPPPKHVFLQVDLKQAESRYVAYRCKDHTLIEMLEDPTQDIHSYVAAEIYRVPISQIIEEKNSGDPSKRQVGKKSGHGANYAMQATTFQEACLKDNLVISQAEAENVLETYHRLFPGIRKWHSEIQGLIRSRGYLENPLGFRRYFYGRHDENTFREAYAFEPQSTIPMITNYLMLYLLDARNRGFINFNLHLQVHDSIVLSALPHHVGEITRIARDTSLWHPKICFPIGDLVIPTDVEISDTNLAAMRPYTA